MEKLWLEIFFSGETQDERRRCCPGCCWMQMQAAASQDGQHKVTTRWDLGGFRLAQDWGIWRIWRI